MSPKRILVIDDEYVIQVVVQSCLEDLAGWEVMTASSGQEGLVGKSPERTTRCDRPGCNDAGNGWNYPAEETPGTF